MPLVIRQHPCYSTLYCHSLCVTFSCFTAASGRGIKTESTTHLNEMKAPEINSEDLENHIQNINAAIELASMAANKLHSVWCEMEYRVDVDRATREVT
ncbi:hypothetical protein AVEN_91361-1 [Araneus ventricosus]|uniref:Uncharacterized protein n=1 Tax=Araneus ventricosus TaxID=182803 RepID=A0A4Y2Q9U1_ARAVE|nr:hypothetical protein AVEN_91361-1 [Araneus ventricosus]